MTSLPEQVETKINNGDTTLSILELGDYVTIDQAQQGSITQTCKSVVDDSSWDILSQTSSVMSTASSFSMVPRWTSDTIPYYDDANNSSMVEEDGVQSTYKDILLSNNAHIVSSSMGIQQSRRTNPSVSFKKTTKQAKAGRSPYRYQQRVEIEYPLQIDEELPPIPIKEDWSRQGGHTMRQPYQGGVHLRHLYQDDALFPPGRTKVLEHEHIQQNQGYKQYAHRGNRQWLQRQRRHEKHVDRKRRKESVRRMEEE